MKFKPYIDQARTWPQAGRHILAQFDDDSIWVYQAYRPAIADYAVAHQRFGGDFSFSRMSWIKPNFLWMMYRSGWATKEGQERVLAVRLRRPFFDELLQAAVPSSFSPGRYAQREDWANAVANSQVRLQWDPDHDPAGTNAPALPADQSASFAGFLVSNNLWLVHWPSPTILQGEDVLKYLLQQGAE